jgi:hypothetical protein
MFTEVAIEGKVDGVLSVTMKAVAERLSFHGVLTEH